MSNELPFLERLNIRVRHPGTEAYEQDLNSVIDELNQVNNEFRQYLNKPLKAQYDVVIIGSGPGGGTLAHALKDTGKSVLLVERGDFLPQEPDNWKSKVVLEEQKYANSEEWVAADGTSYQPNMYYYVGGMTKLYAGTLFRYRKEDFQESRHEDGISPAWPVQYEEFEPYYTQGEQLYFTHGKEGEDPTDPPRSRPFPYPPAPLVPELEEFKKRMTQVGLHPFAVPQGLALFAGGRCVYCGYCDSHPCRVLAKGDPELCCIRPALKEPDVTLLTKAQAVKLLTDSSGRSVVAVEIKCEDQIHTIQAGTFVVSCGAVNTPSLLLRSANEHHPNGLANSSGLVGANYMRHVSTVVLAQNPEGVQLPQNHFWKTVGFNDYYLNGVSSWPYPLGTVQVTGNYHESMPIFLPDSLEGSQEKLQELAAQMLPLFLLTEDLPDPNNRVSLTCDGRIKVAYKANNVGSHKKFIEVVIDKLKQAGYGLITYKTFLDVKQGGGYHHCGTTRFGNDRNTSVLDRYCKAHDLENLYVVDACFFASAPALNPVLTIIANALRVGEHLKCRI
jgi:choline dehydrogenase-like flavoprotein